MNNILSVFFILITAGLNVCSSQTDFKVIEKSDTSLRVGAERIEQYLPLLKGKKVAVCANQTSLVKNEHLIDVLLSGKVNVRKVFAPEHGFRGNAGAGEEIKDSKDVKTGLPVISLYGEKSKPSDEDLDGIDLVIFDIQDVGVRFYTYTSTLQYIMEACAEKKIQVLVLDRPNPNGFYVDGPVLEEKYKSFVGMNPIPVVHGLTVGEYANMLNGERWLKDNMQCDMKVITCTNWNHAQYYELPVKPSPNLPDMAAVYLYPSLCLFEGTMVSVGRGTDLPFKVIGYPGFKNGNYEFTPKSIEGVAKNPPYENQKCSGILLNDFGELYLRDSQSMYLFWLQAMYESAPDRTKFFNSFFNKLAGNDLLQEQIIEGKSEEQIRNSWQPGLEKYKQIRKKYLLYKDFE